MRKIFLLASAILLWATHSAVAQTCEPATDLPDNTIVFPPPQSDLNPEGGISDTAQISCDYEFVVTLANPGTFQGIALEAIAIPTQDAIDNLPSGITYLCNPPNCIIEADSTGCILLYGVPDDTNAPGAYPLVINGSLTLTGGSSIPIFYPGFPGLPSGTYDLHLKDAPGPGESCTTSTEDLLSASVSLRNQPNPTAGYTQIRVSAVISGTFDFVVTDLLGQVAHRERVVIFEGENTIEFDGSALPAGIYTYALRNEWGSVARQMVISRR